MRRATLPNPRGTQEPMSLRPQGSLALTAIWSMLPAVTCAKMKESRAGHSAKLVLGESGAAFLMLISGIFSYIRDQERYEGWNRRPFFPTVESKMRRRKWRAAPVKENGQ
jgi:hypothetical protein